MPQRLRVLMSAYACEPGKGSEPEVGWQWALQMARFHDVTVLTRANNRPPIEAGLAELVGRQPVPRFVYLDLSAAAQRWKKRLGATQLYYWFWQRAARQRLAALATGARFDLLHHTTFAGYRYPVAVAGHGRPSLWGPIGGVECVPWGLLPWRHLPSLGRETLRNLINGAQTAPGSALGRRAAQVTSVLASTREMQQALNALGHPAELMPTVGLDLTRFVPKPSAPSSGPLRFLFVGNLVALKGIDLALAALHTSKSDGRFTIVGDGPFRATCQRLASRLGLAGRVQFTGRKPRSEVLRMYRDYDVVLFPSLHDTGGYAVLEGMASGLPVICLDCGGPALAVREGCGFKVPLGSRRAVIAGLAAAIRCYDQDRALVAAHGQAARQVLEQEYDWAVKARRMNEVYLDTVDRFAAAHPGAERA